MPDAVASSQLLSCVCPWSHAFRRRSGTSSAVPLSCLGPPLVPADMLHAKLVWPGQSPEPLSKLSFKVCLASVIVSGLNHVGGLAEFQLFLMFPGGGLLLGAVFLGKLNGRIVLRECDNPFHSGFAFLVCQDAALGIQEHLERGLLPVGVTMFPGGVLLGAPFWYPTVVGGYFSFLGVAMLISCCAGDCPSA